ncbi:E3 SUMO-protein ligase RanBP2-like [Lutzomyia longipalpis]|uniref:E3 SUMO-protein ligase RanBP2-like n=1 Tax=Lutzomyia longipalpis TaxID=7200 RepID=UPI002483B0E4|nr:E3 SUMO-protein ligase RanBP2-like [Lutzomyia longipalpis]
MDMRDKCGMYKINHCTCNWIDQKKKSKRDKNKALIHSKYLVELKMKQKKIDEQNQIFLEILLRAKPKVDTWATEKIPNRYPKPPRELFPNYLMPMGQIPKSKCCRQIFLEFSPDAEAVQTYGRLSVVLFFDLAPKTCRLFVDYITQCSYGKAISVNKIFTDMFLEFRIMDDSLRDPFDKKHASLQHSHAGTLSAMYVQTRLYKYSYMQFVISFKPLPRMDAVGHAFGYVVQGADLLKYFETFGTTRGWMKEKLFLTRCGLEKNK